jgi:hypothetical protein
MQNNSIKIKILSKKRSLIYNFYSLKLFLQTTYKYELILFINKLLINSIK